VIQSKDIARLRAEIDGLRRELKDVMFARDHALKQLDATRRTIGMQHETSETIAKWADRTFGEVESNFSIWERANLEFQELRFKLMVDDGHPDAACEVADVVLVLDRMLHRLGRDLLVERDEKMRINRARRWRMTSTGHGQHIDDPDGSSVDHIDLGGES
jgi:hypothetical protein